MAVEDYNELEIVNVTRIAFKEDFEQFTNDLALLKSHISAPLFEQYGYIEDLIAKIKVFEQMHELYSNHELCDPVQIEEQYGKHIEHLKDQFSINAITADMISKFKRELHKCVTDYGIFERYGRDSPDKNIFWDKNTFVKKLRNATTSPQVRELLEKYQQYHPWESFPSVTREIFWALNKICRFFTPSMISPDREYLMLLTDEEISEDKLIDLLHKGLKKEYPALYKLDGSIDINKVTDNLFMDDYLVVRKILKRAAEDVTDFNLKNLLKDRIIPLAYEKFGFVRSLRSTFDKLKKIYDIDLPEGHHLMLEDMTFTHPEELIECNNLSEKINLLEKMIFQQHTNRITIEEDELFGYKSNVTFSMDQYFFLIHLEDKYRCELKQLGIITDFELASLNHIFEDVGLVLEERISFNRSNRLSYLDLSNFNLLDLPDELTDFEELESLDISNNEISEANSIQYLTRLKKLNAANTLLLDISPLSQLYELIYLDLTGVTMLTDLTPIQHLSLSKLKLGSTPLSDLSAINLNVKELDLSYTEVTDLSPLADAHRLKSLNLSGNMQLDNILPLLNINTLEEVFLADTNVPEDQIKTLRARGIIIPDIKS